MFYRNSSGYINKLCGWWQRLVVIPSLQCIIFNNPNCDKKRKREKEEDCSSQPSLVHSGKGQKRPSIMGPCYQWDSHIMGTAPWGRKGALPIESLLIKHLSETVPEAMDNQINHAIFIFTNAYWAFVEKNVRFSPASSFLSLPPLLPSLYFYFAPQRMGNSWDENARVKKVIKLKLEIRENVNKSKCSVAGKGKIQIPRW